MTEKKYISGMLIVIALFLSMAAASALSEDFLASGDKVIYANKCSSSPSKMTVYNTGSVSSSYFVTLEGEASEWVAIAPQSFIVKPGMNGEIYNHIKVPCDVPRGEYSLDIIITTKFGTAKKLSQTVFVGKMSNLALKPLIYSIETDPCETSTFKFKVTNTGDFPETYEFSVDKFKDSTSFFPNSAVIPAGKSKTISFSVKPECEVYGEYELSVMTRAKMNDLSAETSGFMLNIAREYGFSVVTGKPYAPVDGEVPDVIAAPASYSMCEQEKLYIPIEIKNLADIPNTYQLNLEKEDGFFSKLDWISLSGNRVELMPRQSGVATISVMPPEPMDKSFDMVLTVMGELGELEKTIPINVDIDICHIPIVAENVGKIRTTYTASAAQIGITNTGAKNSNYIVWVNGADWISAEPENVFVKAGETGIFNLKLNPTAETAEGTYNIEVMVKVDGQGVTYAKGLKVNLKEPRFSNMIFDEYIPYTIGVIVLIILLTVLLIAGLVKLEKTKDERRIVFEERSRLKEEQNGIKVQERDELKSQKELAREEKRREWDARKAEKEKLRQEKQAQKELAREERRQEKEAKKAEKLKRREERRQEKEAKKTEKLNGREERRQEKEAKKAERQKEREEKKKKREEEKQKRREEKGKPKERKAEAKSYSEFRPRDEEKEERRRLRAERKAQRKENRTAWMPLMIFFAAIVIIAVVCYLTYRFAWGFATAHYAELILAGLIIAVLAVLIWTYEKFVGKKSRVFNFEGIAKKINVETGWGKGLGEVLISLALPVANTGMILKKGGKLPFLKPEGQKIYQNFEVLRKNFADEDISSAVMRFKVKRKWLSSKNIREASMKLMRFNGTSWQGVRTSKVDSDKKYVYYESYTSSFSVFAIAGKPDPIPIKPKVITKTVIKIKEVIKRVPVIKRVIVTKEVPVVKYRNVPVIKIKEIIKRIPIIKRVVITKEVPVIKIKKVPVIKIKEIIRKIPIIKRIIVTKEVPVIKYRNVPVVKYKEASAAKVKVARTIPQKRVKKAKRTSRKLSDTWIWVVFGAFVIALLIVAGIFVYKSMPGLQGMITGDSGTEDIIDEPVDEIEDQPSEEEEEPIDEPADEPEEVPEGEPADEPVDEPEEPVEEEETVDEPEEPAVEEEPAEGLNETVEEPPIEEDEPLEEEEEEVVEEPADEPEPEFEEPEWGIQKQEWFIGETHMLDLNQYFHDPDGDVLTFMHTPLEHITVTVSDGIAEFSAEESWTGTEIVKFVADDGKDGIIESNDFRLVVKEEPKLKISVIDSVKKNVSAYSTYIMIGVLILVILILLMEFRKPLTKFLEE